MSSFLEGLKKYFENTPKEKILEAWAKTAEFEGIGITLEELLPAYSYDLDIGSSQKVNNNNFNPEFSSGFFIINNHLKYAKPTKSRLFVN